MFAMGIDLATLLYAAIAGEDSSGRIIETEENRLNEFKKGVRISAIIPVYNEEASLEKVIDALYNQTLPPAEVFVVDDLSTDRTQQICKNAQGKYPALRFFIAKRRNGKAVNINYIVNDYLKQNPDPLSDFALVIDGDTVLYNDSLEKIISNFYDERVSAVTGSSINKMPKSSFSRLIHQGKNYRINIFRFRKRAQSIRNSIFVVNGGYTMYRSSVLKDTPFPTRTRTEDTDHTWTLLETGKKVVYEPDALSYSTEPENLKQYWKQLTRWYSGTHQCLYYHFFKIYKSVGLAFTTVIPGMLESVYSYTILALPAIAAFSPPLAGAILTADAVSTILFGTLIDQKRVDADGNLHVNKGNVLKRWTKNFFTTIMELPGIYAFKFLNSAAWIYSEWKTALELISGKKDSWGKGWERH